MKLSIVIPCRNEVNYIEECIGAIYQNELPEDAKLSIYVVDGMSDDGTRELLITLKEKYSSLELVDNVKQLTPYAFNLGIYAGGEVDFVQIIGARHIVSQTYIKEAVEILEKDKSVWCVGGNIINEYINDIGEVISKAMGTTFGMGLGNFRTLKESGFTDTVTSPMYPYSVFDNIGFFDEELVRNQDDDFNYRVTEAGGKIFFNKDVSLKYYVRGTYSGLWRQFYQYGYWKVYVNKKHQTVTTYRQLVPPLFVIYLGLILLTSIFGLKTFIISSIPFVSYLGMNLLFSLKAAKSIVEFPQIVLTYFILHISYGLGYLRGFLDFIALNKRPGNNQKRLSR
tara:strand:- start:3709 stop:4725 length:1017 start_codon:yes stop_codon:yes gene_type:complete